MYAAVPGPEYTNEQAFVQKNQNRVNGRVDLLSPLPTMNIPNYQQAAVSNTNFYREAVYGQMDRSPASDLFFSMDNIEALHSGIRYRVYKETDIVVGRQSDTELKIVMRSIFLQYFENKPNVPVIEQVRALNALVLEYTVKDVVSNLKQYIKYRKDASTMPTPLQHPQLDTKKGSRTLEFKSWF